MSMTFSAPGPLWYRAYLQSIRPGVGSSVIGSFLVIDSAGDYHNGLAIDGVTVQQSLEVEMDADALPDNVRALVGAAVQRLVIAEYGGVQSVILACIAQGVQFP